MRAKKKVWSLVEGGQDFRQISILGFFERRGSYDLVGIIGILGTKLNKASAKENPWGKLRNPRG
jgi:hypothetical protein